MFERFTGQARTVVKAAQEEARRAGSADVRPEHLLVALADHCAPLFVTEAGPLPPLGEPYRVSAPKLRGLLAAEEPDAEALSRLGISLAEVRRAVEDAFGPDAWAPRHEGRPPFAPETRRALEDALREAVELRTRRIGPQELLLGLLRRGDTACALLVRCGVDPGELYERRRAAIERLGRLVTR